MSDLIRREDVVEYIKSQLWIDGFVEVPADELISSIRALPAVQPDAREAERERCAKVVDAHAATIQDLIQSNGDEAEVLFFSGAVAALKDAAADIRITPTEGQQ